ncbi:MAG TPA: ATP-grasp domain-containing protein [Jatrophihabitans sp.]|jgi:biotin carboxylase|uniref:ATP-grasp domain-containing protein n=1 Tax=Jatrophihabitans sp. TaxID=1932789 RepID=UPI002EED584D
MSERAVVLFNPRDLVLRAARRLGLDTVVVIQQEAPTPPGEYVDELLRCEWLTDLDAALAQLAPLASSCVGAFGFGEIGSYAAAVANERFHWPGNTLASLLAFQRKAALRAAVGDRAGRPVRHRVCLSLDELLAGAELIGYPCVVKPMDGTGSAGVRYLAGSDDCRAYADQFPVSGGVLIEEYLLGREVSVEAMSVDGQHTLLAVTEKITTGRPDFVEMGHTLPISLDKPEHDRLWNVVEATLTAAGHRYGVSHTEVMLTRTGPQLIESHGRPGGDRISDLIQLATGIDVFEQTMALTLGIDCDLEPRTQRLAGIRYLSFDTAVALAALDLAPVERLPGIHEVVLSVPAGQRPSVVHRSADRHGFVVATGADSVELAANLDRASAAVYQQLAH